MDVYRQAAEIVGIVREGNGTAKALCLRKEMQKKKQTYAVVCETLRHYELLEDVLEVAEFFKYYPQANRNFAMCMAYDVVLGKGVNTNNDSTARAVTQSASFLRDAYWQVHKHHVIPPRNNEKWEEPEDTSDGANKKAASSASSSTMQIPRYARVNTLKIAVDELMKRLRRSAEARKRAREEGDEGTEDSGRAASSQSKKPKSNRPHRPLPDFALDPVVPHLLVFPPGTDLHAHPAVRSGQLILQDRASCLPAAVLLDAVPVAVTCSDAPDSAKKKKSTGDGTPSEAPARKPLEYVVDACAAPGNKTTQLAALGAPDVKIMATERDERRAELLLKRVTSLGAADYVNVVNMDFFQLSSDDRAATEGILLDPSCSASGVMTRVDVALQHHHREQQRGKGGTSQAAAREHAEGEEGAKAEGNGEDAAAAAGAINPDEQGNNFSMKEERVEKLARLQRKLLAHALLSFDNCRTVVYSTCSVHEEENEAVVRQVLDDERVQARGWQLSNIMPTQWKTRGVERAEGETHPLRYTIRCDPATDSTNGFYVARFDRTC